MQFLVNADFDLIGKRKIALIFSSVLILIGLVSLVIQKGPNYGIDFLGGTAVELRFEQAPAIGDVRTAVGNAGFSNAEIKNFGQEIEVLIRVEEQSPGTKEAIIKAVSAAFPGNPFEVRYAEIVGPKIGSELKTSMIGAILFALALILIYISIRFQFIFAVGAIAALFHDVLITLGIFSVLRLELTLAIIAAFLTIVGYSLNDTIVVFDRIRENLKILRRDSYEVIINKSINQSLTRTLVTSLTTLMVVSILFFFGGRVIRDFAFALIIGVLIGTYSSIFIASPILVEWQKRRELKKGRIMPKRT